VIAWEPTTGVVWARQEFSQVAVKLLGYAGVGVGRYLRVTSSCVTRAALLDERLGGLQVRYKIRQSRFTGTSPPPHDCGRGDNRQPCFQDLHL